MKKDIEYTGTGFSVRLVGFPVYEDDAWYGPDVPMYKLYRVIAARLIERPNLLTGAELAFLRALADLTRSEAARKLGVTRRTLINWEDRGKKPIGAPPLVHLALRARFFEWLFPGQDLPARALGLVAQKAKEPIAIRFTEENLRWESPGGGSGAARARSAGGTQGRKSRGRRTAPRPRKGPPRTVRAAVA
jgi:DNA-binding XRE family transcriptional regulator